MNFITTGTRSGLGRHLAERFGGRRLERSTPEAERAKLYSDGADVILHCAANAGKDIDLERLGGYVEDNVLLTDRLTAVPHGLFVYMSSVDVYPRDGGPHKENEALAIDAARGLYPMTKLMSEALVRRRCRNALILRLSTPLTAYSRKNTTMRLLEEPGYVPGLSGDSRFNYVLGSDIAEFLAHAFERRLTGTYNIAASGNVTLADAAAALGRKGPFGSHRYDVGEIDNALACAESSAFKRSSLATLELFARQQALAAAGRGRPESK